MRSQRDTWKSNNMMISNWHSNKNMSTRKKYKEDHSRYFCTPHRRSFRLRIWTCFDIGEYRNTIKVVVIEAQTFFTELVETGCVFATDSRMTRIRSKILMLRYTETKKLTDETWINLLLSNTKSAWKKSNAFFLLKFTFENVHHNFLSDIRLEPARKRLCKFIWSKIVWAHCTTKKSLKCRTLSFLL